MISGCALTIHNNNNNNKNNNTQSFYISKISNTIEIKFLLPRQNKNSLSTKKASKQTMKKIRPYLDHTLDLKNLFTYREFLKKRPKKARQFKFSMIRSQLKLNRADEKEIQLKLLRMLKIAKPAIKVDFKECEIKDARLWKAKLLSLFKKICYVRILSLTSPKNYSKIKYFKYFAKLQRLTYQLNGYYSPGYHYNVPNKQSLQNKNPLKCLEYCPRIKVLEISDRTNDCSFLYSTIGFKRHLRFLEHLTLRSEGWGQMEFDFPIEFCENLRSISFKFYDVDFRKSISKFMNALSMLPNLQEIDLSARLSPSFDLLEIFQKIAKKCLLQKIKLELGSGVLKLEKILETLKVCKLTSFSLKAFLKGGLLNSISGFLKSMSHLESLELQILSRNLFSKIDNFVEICKQINNLQALRSLKLNFETSKEVPESARIPNFIPYLHNLFTKQIKTEVLHIECDQLVPSGALQSLLFILKNSASFLTHLKINFGALPCTKKTYQYVLKLMRNLSNIQALGIPCLEISGSASQFFNEMVQVLYAYKYLRVFIIGEIKGTVPKSVFENGVETIARKRGLRQFRFSMSQSLIESLAEEGSVPCPNMRRIREENPQLDAIDFEENFQVEDFQ